MINEAAMFSETSLLELEKKKTNKKKNVVLNPFFKMLSFCALKVQADLLCSTVTLENILNIENL